MNGAKDGKTKNIYLETNGRDLAKASEQIILAQQEQEEYKQPWMKASGYIIAH